MSKPRQSCDQDIQIPLVRVLSKLEPVNRLRPIASILITEHCASRHLFLLGGGLTRYGSLVLIPAQPAVIHTFSRRKSKTDPLRVTCSRNEHYGPIILLFLFIDRAGIAVFFYLPQRMKITNIEVLEHGWTRLGKLIITYFESSW